MDIIRKQETRSGLEKTITMLALVIVCIFINSGGAWICNRLGLPLYLDLIGTMIASMLGGYIPGILVGLAGPLLTTVTSDPMAISYGALNVSVAVVTTFFHNRDWTKKLAGVISMIIIDAFIGGVGGALITWYLYGFGAEDTSSSLVRSIHALGIFSAFTSELIADFLIDVVDKIISVSFALIVIQILPAKFKGRFHVHAWKQAPLTSEIVREFHKKKSRTMSLRLKLVSLLTVASFLIGASAMLISYYIYYNSMVDRETELAEGIAQRAAACVDGNRIDEFIEKGEAAEGYNDTYKELEEILNTSDSIVEYVYVYKIMEDGCHVVFDVDTEDVPGGEPGDIVGFKETIGEYRSGLSEAEEMEPIVVNDKFGWVLTVFEPVMDSSGKVRAHAGVDISMHQIMMQARSFRVRMISLFFGVFALILAVSLFFVEYQMILPLNTMAYTASIFTQDREESLHDTVELFNKIDIETGDETENLYLAFSEMTEDNLNYLDDIKRKNETINDMQNALILVLADMVESRDQNTGEHVKKTALYTRIIMEELRKEGIYCDKITDKFMSDVFKSAPLHDIGKIKVSDRILNKPSRLDDEEYKKMKNHTIAGAEIIDQVIEKVPESDYLNEARNLALYHHERWDGKGYPMGLSGENIPLSARIMAVADVFDALASDRCYKKAFSIEESMDIILEGSGTHFDPNVARAFANAADKVREVVESTKAIKRSIYD
ncbi:HD-GYP domain-containing protein [Butyrivibrio sp. XPD2006]|uniref:HD-GYP domain-containing protein n=1 Tax=Butyrivibrio sp. XPD2006 TaxID=1280668 RepID=UPI0003B7080F|nr:HD-GYP domain-containing protein [Butyrivibrio sp. XPD2006]